MHAEWGWLAAGGAAELDWWLMLLAGLLSSTVSAQWPLRRTPAEKHTQKAETSTHTLTYSIPKYCYSLGGTHRHTVTK